jgi:hypothetical protein
VRKQAQMRESSSGTISSSFAQNSSYLHQGLQQTCCSSSSRCCQHWSRQSGRGMAGAVLCLRHGSSGLEQQRWLGTKQQPVLTQRLGCRVGRRRQAAH